MKKLLLIFGALCLIYSSCTKEETVEIKEKTPILIESISTPEAVKTLNIGETFQIQINIKPQTADNQTISFKSSDENIASISAGGLVKALAAGNATITVTSEEGQHTATCNIIVRANTIHVSSISLDYTTLRIEPNESKTIETTILPEDATNKNVTWYSDNIEIATVDNNGLVSGIKEGTTTVVATTVDGAKYAECIVNVTTIPDPNACIDKAGRVYKTVKIGDQVWMAENLAYLPVVGKPGDKGGYYVYDYLGYDIDEAKATENYKKHGVLYSYTQAKASCPKGWHIPSDEEWKTLEKFIGMSDYEINEAYGANRGELSGVLKAKEGWTMYNGINGTDDYGLTLIPSGSTYKNDFAGIGWGVWLFTSTTTITEKESRVVMRNFKSDVKGIMRYDGDMETSIGTVRCIKD